MDNEIFELQRAYRDRYQKLQEEFVEEVKNIMRKRKLHLKEVSRKSDNTHGLLTVVRAEDSFIDFDAAKELEENFLHVGLKYSTTDVSMGLQPLIEDYVPVYRMDEFSEYGE